MTIGKRCWIKRFRLRPNQAALPMVYYSTNPRRKSSCLTGHRLCSPIAGTSLSYATNTSDNIFFSSQTTSTIILLPEDGSVLRVWMAPGHLPRQIFRQTLPISLRIVLRGHVLSSVPGTDEAADAVMIAQIPTKMVMDPKAAPAVTITYSGDPKYVVIDGTTLSYAENTSEKVIMVTTLSVLCLRFMGFGMSRQLREVHGLWPLPCRRSSIPYHRQFTGIQCDLCNAECDQFRNRRSQLYRRIYGCFCCWRGSRNDYRIRYRML